MNYSIGGHLNAYIQGMENRDGKPKTRGTVICKNVKEKDAGIIMNAIMKVTEQRGIAVSKGNQVVRMSRRNITSTYKFKRVFFRHDRRTAPKFGTHVRIETRLALTKKLTNPIPEGFRGLFFYVCGMFVGYLCVA